MLDPIDRKNLATVMIAVGALLSGCVAIPYSDGPSYATEGRTYSRDGSYYGDRTYSRDSAYSSGFYDRDRDGVPNRQDRYPYDARRY